MSRTRAAPTRELGLPDAISSKTEGHSRQDPSSNRYA